MQLGGRCLGDTEHLTACWEPYKRKLATTQPSEGFQSDLAEKIGRTLSLTPMFNVHYMNADTLDELSRADGWQDMPREMFQGEGDVGAFWAKIQKSRAVTSVAE